jgi:hypothetical protein
MSDGGSKHLRNVSQFLLDFTAQHPRGQPSSLNRVVSPMPNTQARLPPSYPLYLERVHELEWTADRTFYTETFRPGFSVSLRL